jgi:hypothetical protein
VAGAKRRNTHVQRERYWKSRIGRVEILVAQPPPAWRAGVRTAQIFAGAMNSARELADEIRELTPRVQGGLLARSWRLRAAWFGAWLAADAILRPSLRDGRIVRSPWFLSPTTARRFERFSAANGIHFTTGVKGVPHVAGDIRPEVALRLYNFFESPARDRLKWCPPCGQWFVDKTKNRTQRWSEGCRNKAWSRAARRAARHPSQRAAGRHVRTKKGARQ